MASTHSKAGLTTLSWTARETKEIKTRDWYWAFWILIGTIALVTFMFSGLISALVILSGAWAISSYLKQSYSDKEHKYELTLKGIRVDGVLFHYQKIRRFNILTHNDVRVLVLDVQNMLMPDLVIPFHEQDEEDIYFYISQFVEEDVNMQVPITHIIAERIGL